MTSSTDDSNTSHVKVDSPPATHVPAAAATRGRDARAELADTLMTAIAQRVQSEKTENISSYVELGIKVLEAASVTPAHERDEREGRQAGMWLGSVIATACIIGGVVAGIHSQSPALLSITLLCLGAACAGATFGVIGGNRGRADKLLREVAAQVAAASRNKGRK